jgi:hypothetical protein
VSGFCTKLKAKCVASEHSRGTGKFDWHKLGQSVGVCFNSVPSGICVMNGPLSTVYSPRQRQRRLAVKEEASEDEATKAKYFQNKKGAHPGGSASEQIEARIRAVQRRIKEKYREQTSSPKQPICFIQTLFDPTSFTKTVENLFYTSFLVKENRIKVDVIVKREREERNSTTTTTTPVVAPIKCNRMQKLPPPTQAIVSLTMKDWRALVDAYNVHADNDTETDEEEVANDNNHDDVEKEVNSRDRSTVAAAVARARGKANARSTRH